MDTGPEALVPSCAELVARADGLVAILRDNAAETRERRRLADANVEALRRAGLFRLLQPRRWGGLEADMRTHLEVVAKIAEGCPSTGWVLGVMQIHSWLAAHFPEAAQAEIYGDDPGARIAAVLTPRGEAVAVEGGYRLSGFWPFASGCDHAQWLMLGAQIEGGEEAILLVPAGDVVNTGDWDAGGLRGTGSHSVRLDGAFVAGHRCLSFPALLSGEAAVSAGNAGPLYRSAAVPVLCLALTGTAVGAAETAYARFVERLPGRQVAYMDGLQQETWTATHLQVAQARTKVDVAQLLLRRVADAIDECARGGRAMPLAERGRARADCAWAVRQCLEAVETLYIAGGGSGLAAGNPIQLAQQDLHAVNMHGILMLETNLDVYGRVLLGQAPGTHAI